MKILAIDSSTRHLSLAVLDGTQVLKQSRATIDKKLSDSIIPEIKKILAASGCGLSDINAFVVGLGPGSFTSLRVGLSTVKALVFSTRQKVIGVGTLDALALACAEDGQICVLADARRSMVYSARYVKEKEALRKAGDYVLAPVAQALSGLKGPVIFTGDGIGLYKSEIEQICRKRKIPCTFTEEKTWKPQASDLTKLAVGRLTKKRYDDIRKLVPVYLYPENCQVRK